MADENKTERLHMLISPSELKAIDDWGFKNRIRTKAEAVRRLCQIGLSYDQDSKQVENSSRRALRELFGSVAKLAEQRKNKSPAAQLREAHLTLLALLDTQLDLHRDIVRLLRTEEALSDHNTDVETAIEIAAQIKTSLDDEERS